MSQRNIPGTRKEEGNNYETPIWAVEALLKRESFEGEILEPCCGLGKISKTLETYGYTVISSDKRNGEKIYGTGGVDVYSIKQCYSNIITNPPYERNLDNMVRHMSLLYKNKMALLLRLNFLESERRFQLFVSSPLKVVYIFSSRVTMYPEGTEAPQNKGTISYAWFVWEKGYTGPTILKFIDDKQP